MRRILVVQTTRMGDMLQTSPLIRLLRRAHPKSHITVMIRKMSRSVAECIPGIDEIFIYDEDEIFKNLRSSDSERLLRAYEMVVDYVKRIQGGKYDVAYNCAQSIGSALLLKMAQVPIVIGAHYSADWQFILRGRWTNYLFTSLRHRMYSDFNLCDVFRNLAYDDSGIEQNLVSQEIDPLSFEIHEQHRQEARELLHKNGIADSAFLVAFQLGASEVQKRWPVHRFAGLARLLREKYDPAIVLLGVKDEAVLGQEFDQFYNLSTVKLFGQTTIPVLAAVLERANVLVTNDTGTMHIAAAVKCPTVVVSVGTVHFRETGPYGEGHCAIECAQQLKTGVFHSSEGVIGEEDRGVIKPEQVLKAVEVAINHTGQQGTIPDEEGLSNVVIHRSAFAPDGCLEWYPVILRPIEETDLLRMAYRAMWLDFLRRREGDQDREIQEINSIKRMLAHYLPAHEEILDNVVTKQNSAFRELEEMAREGMSLTEDLLHLLQANRFLDSQPIVKKLSQLDERIRLHGELNSWVKPLSASAAFERGSLEGSNPVLLAQTTWHIYEDLLVRAHLMQIKLRTIKNCIQPQA